LSFFVVKGIKNPFATAYFSCLDTRKVTKESQEILNSPSAQTVGFHKKDITNYEVFILRNFQNLNTLLDFILE